MAGRENAEHLRVVCADYGDLLTGIGGCFRWEIMVTIGLHCCIFGGF